MVNYKSVFKKLNNFYPDAFAILVANESGKIIFVTDRWGNTNNIKKIISIWNQGLAPSFELHGNKYSIVQISPERFVATNFSKKGHLIGASIPGEDKYVFAKIKPKAKSWHHEAYPAVARAAAMMKKDAATKSFKIEKSKKKKKKKIKKQKTEKIEKGKTKPITAEIISTEKKTTKLSTDPNLRLKINGFLEWIKDPGDSGLANYISYYLSQNDQKVISGIAYVYNRFKQIFNF